MITIKRGDTLSVAGVAAQDSGVALNLTGYTVRSQVRSSAGALVAALSVTVTSATLGTFTLDATAAATASWLTGRHVCDVEYTSAGGIVSSTETFAVVVLDDVTR